MVEIKKNNTEIIRISQSEFKGKSFIDCRVWFREDDNSDWKPTKKGIAFNPSVTKELVEGLLQVHEQINWDEFK